MLQRAPSAVEDRSPGDPGGGCRLPVAASVVGLLYAAISAYWGLGGTWLLDTVGSSLVTGSHSAGALAAVWAAVLLKVAAVVILLLALRAPPSHRWHRALVLLAWAQGVILTGYGLVLTVTGLLVQAGIVATARTADRRALTWHAYLWDPWFLVWGLLVLIALIMARGSTATLKATARHPGARSKCSSI